MPLTLARLCGELRLVSKNYGARSGKYEAWIVIFRIPTTNYLYSNRRGEPCPAGKGITMYLLFIDQRLAAT
jgi:hypothetical protein